AAIDRRSGGRDILLGLLGVVLHSGVGFLGSLYGRRTSGSPLGSAPAIAVLPGAENGVGRRSGLPPEGRTTVVGPRHDRRLSAHSGPPRNNRSAKRAFIVTAHHRSRKD